MVSHLTPSRLRSALWPNQGGSYRSQRRDDWYCRLALDLVSVPHIVDVLHLLTLWHSIMQGLITCIAGIVGALTIADFPEKAANKTKSFAIPFLSQEEAAFVVARIEKDRHDAIPEEFNLGKYMRGALDLKIWGFAALFGLTTTW